MTNNFVRPTTRRLALLAAFPLTGVLFLAGCAAGSDTAASAGSAPTAESSPSTSTAPTASPSPSAAPADSSTEVAPNGSSNALVRAGRTALSAAGSGTIVSIEQEAGGSSWEVLIVSNDGREREVHLSRDGSSVTAGPTAETMGADDLRENKAFLAAAKLSYANAAVGLTDTVAGTITEIGLDDYAGAVVWEGDVVDSSNVKHSIRINAGTGDVVSNAVGTED